MGFGIGSIAIIAGSIVAATGQPVAGGIIGGTAVVGLVSAFILGRTVLRPEAEPDDSGGHDKTLTSD